MRILLTGASGLLGGNFAAVASVAGHELIGTVGRWSGPPIGGLTRQVPLDLAEFGVLDALVRSERPQVIVNCAAMSEPAQCDREQDRSAVLNVELPHHLAELAADLGARIVHISSEQVFDGTRAPYRASDPVAPITLYGRQKAESERLVVGAAGPLAAVVRVPLLLGNSPGGNRSVHERLVGGWREGRVARLFTDEIRQVCMADNLAAVLLELCPACSPVGVFHWAGAQPVSRFELGVRIAERFGFDPAQRIVATQLAGTPLAEARQADLSMDLHPLDGLISTRPEPLAAQLARLTVRSVAGDVPGE